jgi:glycosyltransferase involved in cell wall biosynthesis
MADTATPKLSVIIPTYNRLPSLQRTLAALYAQTLPHDRFEVIVIDDGSPDDTPSIAQREHPIAFRYERQANQGAAVARDRGVQLASGDVLVFLDDDIALTPGSLEAFARAHAQFDKLIAVGSLQTLAGDQPTVFQSIYAVETSTLGNRAAGEWEIITFVDCLTGLFSVKRAHYFEIGKLRDLIGDGRVAWGDLDFGYRACGMGFRFVRCLQVLGYHDDFSIRDLQTYAQRWRNTSRSAVKLFRAHPEVRSHLPMFDDKGPIVWGQDRPALIARKLARSAASSGPVMGTLQRAAQVLERRGDSAWLRRVYRWIIGGYVYQGFREGLEKF